MRVALLLAVPVLVIGCSTKPPALAVASTASSGPLALSPDGRTLWVVNPDADSVTAVDTLSLEVKERLPVGDEPWSVAVSPGHGVVVMNRADGTLSLLRNGSRSDIEVGPEPGGLVISADGSLAYVTISGTDEVVVVDLAGERVSERFAVGAYPWAIARQGATLIVGHRFARPQSADGQDGSTQGANNGKEAWLTVLEAGREAHEISLAPFEFGFANGLEGLAVTADNVFAVHQLNRPEYPRTFDTSVSGALSSFDLLGGAGIRLDLNDSAFSTPTNFPRAVAVMPDSSRAYLALAGSDAVMGIGLSDPGAPRLLGFWPVGSNPRGIVVDAGTQRAYVMNYLSRDVSVLDLSDSVNRPELARVTVAPETLDSELLLGKRLFNNATDPRLSRLGWISCASCHPDGGSDGTTWDTPDGLRQTLPLWSAGNTAPFHASATRDEVQDIEHDIETLMRGIGLAPGAARPELGEPNAGTSSDLDALARFVSQGIRVPNAKPASSGRATFEASGCVSCHGGPAWTRNGRHDVGTFDTDSDVLGASGFDTPSLLGLNASAPYLHDGSADGLEEVLSNPVHTGTTLGPQQRADLAAFLLSIDAETEPFE